jgi:hypothetical protein
LRLLHAAKYSRAKNERMSKSRHSERRLRDTQDKTERPWSSEISAHFILYDQRNEVMGNWLTKLDLRVKSRRSVWLIWAMISYALIFIICN